VEEQQIRITFEEEKEGWRASDLKIGEGCIHNGNLYIKLGWGDVELRVEDEFRTAAGIDGAQKKKHFFFRPLDACITTLIGAEVITPVSVEIIVRKRMPAHAESLYS